MNLNKSIVVLLEYLKRFSPGTYEHSMNVALLSLGFGRFLDLPEEQLNKLKTACLLHDIGKIKIPSHILHKRGKLTDEEYEVMKNHSKYGHDLLIKIGFNDSEILSYVLNHHEKLDGSGYPNHISNRKINNITRIITICDCYDAMKSKRDYKNSRSYAYIKNEFLKNIGTQFDPEYTSLFLQFIESSKKRNVVVRRRTQ